MTVVFVNSTRKWGGVKTWTLDFGQALRERGHRVVAVVRRGTPFVNACRERGLTVYPFRFGCKYNLAAIVRMLRVFRSEAPDVVFVNISKDLEVGAVAAKICGLPVIHRVGLAADYRGTWEERLRHRHLVDKILVPTASMKQELVASHAWIESDQVAVIPNSKRIRGDPERRVRADDVLVLGTTSQLSLSKGHTYAMRAMKQLVDMGLRVKWRIAGNGPLEDSLRGEVAELGLEAAVFFDGFQGDVQGFLAGLDVFVLPSLKEGFPNTLVEAMCMGLPIVASNLPGVREMLGDAGLLVPPGDADAIARAVRRLVDQTRLRRQLGEAARRRAGERYDVGANVGAMEALIQEVVHR